jgi:hypothetical protein
MGEVADLSGIPGNATQMLNNGGSTLLNSLSEFSATVKTMHATAHRIAGVDVGLVGWPHIVAGEFKLERRTLHH